MKRMITLFFVIVMSLSLLTGCGSKEQQAMEEIGRQIEKEAKEDGVDLSKMLQEEKAASESRTASKSEIREAQKELRSQLDAYYDPLLQEEYDAMIAAETAQDTLAHGKRYNELIEERNALGEAQDLDWTGKSSYLRLDASYISKAMHLSASGNNGTEYKIYCHSTNAFSTTDSDRLMLICAESGKGGNWKELTFMKQDGAVCSLDLSNFIEPGTYVSIETASESALQLWTIENADWIWYLFDISGSEGILTAKSSDLSTEAYNEKLNQAFPREGRMSENGIYSPVHGNTLEELNRMVLRNTKGCAANNCSCK